MARRSGGTETDREIARGLFRLEEERREVASVLGELREGTRTWQDLAVEERNALEGAPSIEFLLDRSLALRYSDPENMLRCAELAVRMADALGSERYGDKLLSDLKAKAWCVLANAYRITDQLAAAEVGFEKALAHAQAGTGSPQILTRIAEMLAVLARVKRQFSKAASILEGLISYYTSVSDSEALARSILSRGYVASEANEPEEGIRWLTVALRYLPADNQLKLSAIHNLTMSLVDAGYPLEAQAILKRHERLYRRSGKLNVLRRFWLQGRISRALGNSRRAEGELHVARLGFGRLGLNYDAALVSLDLALIYTRAGQRTSTIRLVDEMVRTFRELGIAREAIASLLLLRKYCDRHWNPETISAQIETIAVMVAELGGRQERLPRPSA